MSSQNHLFVRSDLALELAAPLLQEKKLPEGLSVHTRRHGMVEITCVTIETPSMAKQMGKPRGKYITIQTPPLWNSLLDPQDEIQAAAETIRSLLPSHGSILVVGLGNNGITPDALGPQVIQRTLATRHLTGELAQKAGLDGLRKTAAIAPGVMGQTGIETSEVVAALVNFIQPAAVLAIDALAAQDYNRLGRTIQIADSGIAPGAGVQNARRELSERTLGIPVISIGVPTVIDGATLTATFSDLPRSQISPEAAGTVVTPREVDRMIGHAAKFISLAVNKSLYPELSLEEISFLCA